MPNPKAPTEAPSLPADGQRLMWDDCPIYRLRGGPFSGLLRELHPEANAIAFGPGFRGDRTDTYVLKDGVLQHSDT